MKADEAKQRDEDARAQDEYALMLDKQDQDRTDEMKLREQRAQDFMNKMADSVLAKMSQK
jgi:hypothetical protein